MDSEEKNNLTPDLYNIASDSNLSYHKINVQEAVKAIHYHSGNISAASRQLGTSRQTLHALVSSSKDLTTLVEQLRYNKQQGLYEQAIDKASELMNCGDLPTEAKVTLKLIDKGMPDAKAEAKEDTEQANTIEKLKQRMDQLDLSHTKPINLANDSDCST